MPISTPEKAVETLADLASGGTVELVVSSGTGEERSHRSLALDDEARGFFADAAAGVAARLKKADEFVPYDATYKPDAQQFLWAPRASFPAVELTVSAFAPVSKLTNFDPGDESFKAELRFATTVLRKAGQSAYLFRSFTRTHELSQKKWIMLMLRGGRFGPPKDRLFQFDTDADAVLVGDVLIVVHLNAFRRLFEALEEVFAEAHRAADAVRKKLPIANFDEFKDAVGRDANLADKVIAVSRRPYFDRLDIDAIEKTNTDFGLGVPIVTVDGKKSLEFRPAPRERWKLLKLLDDDYLSSTMTSLRYEVNSKRSA